MGTWVDGEPVGSALTTPEAPDLHALFAVMRERGVEVCAMEVSSHALVMGRVDGVVFDLAVVHQPRAATTSTSTPTWTTTSRPRRSSSPPERAPRGRWSTSTTRTVRRLRERSRDRRPRRSRRTGATADWRADRPCALDAAAAPPSTSPVPAAVQRASRSAMPGEFNVANALLRVAACGEAGVDVDAAATGHRRSAAVAGRMERVDAGTAVHRDRRLRPQARRRRRPPSRRCGL